MAITEKNVFEEKCKHRRANYNPLEKHLAPKSLGIPKDFDHDDQKQQEFLRILNVMMKNNTNSYVFSVAIKILRNS